MNDEMTPFKIYFLKYAIKYFSNVGDSLFRFEFHNLDWYKVYLFLIKDNIFDIACDEYKEILKYKDVISESEELKNTFYKYFKYIKTNNSELIYKLFDLNEETYKICVFNENEYIKKK